MKTAFDILFYTIQTKLPLCLICKGDKRPKTLSDVKDDAQIRLVSRVDNSIYFEDGSCLAFLDAGQGTEKFKDHNIIPISSYGDKIIY